MTKKVTGPDLWYQGCPNLIFYSKLYGNKPKITMKELQKRRSEVDEQIKDKIEMIAAVNQAMELISKSTEMTTHVFTVFHDNKNRLDGQLNDLRRQWEIVDGASIELEQKNKIVQQ